MKTKLILASALTALSLAAPAFANDSDDVKAAFAKADTNSDSTLSPAEFKGAWPDHADAWGSVDANSDGKVTLEEKQAAHAKMNAEKHG